VAISKAFKISPKGLVLNNPAKITFQSSASNGTETESGTSVGIFRWDGSNWDSMGYFPDDGDLSVSAATFSIFVRVEIIQPEVWKKFVFLNKGNDPANLMVWRARPYDAISYPAGSWRGSVNIPDASADYPERSLWLPLGCYEFCYEWMIYNTTEFKREMVHNFEGNTISQHCLDDQTGLASGQSVWIDTTYGEYNGPCGSPPGIADSLWQWQPSGTGDYQGCDVTNTKGSAIPDPTLAKDGLIAVCWDGITICNPPNDCSRYGAWCTYKDLSMGNCPEGASTGNLYTSVPSEF
jgi:hypothetical protein